MGSATEPTEAAQRVDGAGAARLVWITSASSRFGAEALKELWQFRDVVVALTLRYIRIKYAQVWFGAGWAALQPLVLAGIVALLAARFNLGGEDVFIEVLIGMMAWSFFATALGGAAESLLDGRELLTKIYFPREAMPLAAVIAAGLDLLVSAVVVLGIAVTLGHAPNIAWLGLPVALSVVAASALTAGLAASVINAYYRDLRYALPFALQVGLFASAVFYPIDALPHADAYAVLNPVAGAIDELRQAVLDGGWPDPAVVLGQVLWLSIALLLSYQLFRRLAPSLVERM
jgi:lipopolysaccharide transport system permease protein